ncbi:gamma-glutamyl-gamma-aminobutyrate hydrolase family protein [Pseudomonas fluorescens]|uniref:gamma-glutamyl-gamma-aminobutyrate hydrolase n=1 Tax=Pseudomonas fluorescens TaxID=294 RepID=A0A5E7ERX3_PSEFL|nr:gamma-glutamyl-gamma-aminobutyrate hydrolase family protein [Pseudomonas fluorescens]VVO29444.1 Gamma-glutamyl-gamma-aminobutyrate hydrolase PuuD [Pseudomonas fluorescens]
MSRLPLIGVTACSRQIGLHAYHISGDKYVRAVASAAKGLPVILPSLADLLDPSDILDGLDGILFTGSPSNIEPFHYSGPASAPGTAHDSARDATTLPLIRAAVEAGIPVLGICRGFQEMNVAFGGSLHQKVHEAGPFMDHREDDSLPLEGQYAPRHPVHIQPGGVLAGLGLASEIQVNSIHGQGVERLAPGLRVEALAPDGLIEAISVGAEPVNSGRGFALGVQWHPEWQVSSNPDYLAIFQAFGDACRKHALQRDADASNNA